MSEFSDYRKSFSLIFPENKGYEDASRLADGIMLLANLGTEISLQDKQIRRWALSMSANIKNMSAYYASTTGRREYDAIHERALLFEAPELFESYMLFMESHRDPKKRFYEPRQATLKVVTQDLQDLEDGKLDFYGLSLPPRTGKALADETPVLTRNGFKKHGDLSVGDEVVSPDGGFVKVLSVFPKCEMEYRVTFTNGESIVCHGNHEWEVYSRHCNKTILAETKDLADDYENKAVGRGHRYYYMMPPTSPFKGCKRDVKVAPYLLGVWLGNGRTDHPDICGATNDVAVIVKVAADLGYEVSWEAIHKTTGVKYVGFDNLRNGLQEYGMCFSRKKTEKRIPEEYFTCSIEQRLELLAGLLDTDGCLRKKEHRYDFSTTSPLLKDGFIRLVSTFGWRCSVVAQEPKTSSSGIVGRKVCWKISFNPDKPIPCKIPRKQLCEFSKKRRIAISRIEKIRGNIRGNCIQVEGGMYLAGKTLIPTHNSTDCIFFLSWVMGKRPNAHNAMSGHSGMLAEGFYGEVLNLLGPEYRFGEIFPDVKLQRKSAEKNEINLNAPDRFATLTCRGIEGTWTGAVDISSDGYLYVDDLVRDREESLSPIRLENRYQDYLNVLVDRKNDGSRELMVGTRWNVLDPLGRIESLKKDNPRYRFRKIPALNDEGESNFKYLFGVGFSTEYFKDIRDRLDSNEWMAKYQQKPFVREGLLFPEDSLRYYNGTLPEGDSRIASAVDVAWGGGDSLSMPVGREFANGDVFIPDWIFDKGKKEETIPKVAGRIESNGIKQINFEANNGGDMYCDAVSKELENRHYKCSCTHSKAPGNMAKMQKIIAYSGEIIKHFVFLEKDKRSPEYQAAMEELISFVTIGKNPHDDAPDGLAQLAAFLYGGYSRETRVMDSPF